MSSSKTADFRNLEQGRIIPSLSYADQPYIAVLPNGRWVCSLTTVAGHEGDAGQHVSTMVSEDEGQTWSAPVPLEPEGSPESSWSVPLHVPNLGGPLGRVYIFYVFNGDNLREAKGFAQNTSRVDSLGYYVFRYSDDGGKSWSADRHIVPVREFQVDRDNPTGGAVRYFWNVGRPIVAGGRAIVPIHKLGDFGEGFLCLSQGCFVASDNILTEPDPAKLNWETLPDGDVGLLSPQGPISEEHSIVELSDGTLFCVWRSVMGHPIHAYSRDGGHTWTKPAIMKDGSGQRMKHPRAANFVWKCANGKYLYWFHHHGWNNYGSRNPAWLCGGHEIDGPDGKLLEWSQPEILLYDDDLSRGISYPDLIVSGGRFFVSETQKTVARTHEIPLELLESLWGQFTNTEECRTDLAWESAGGSKVAMPRMPSLHSDRGGFTLEFGFRLTEWTPWHVLFDSRDERGWGVLVQFTDRGTIRFSMQGGVLPGIRGGIAESSWECDRDILRTNTRHHVAIIVDGGPKIISFIIDGVHLNGGQHRTHGWGRLHPQLEEIDGAREAAIGNIDFCRLHLRALLTSEVVGNSRLSSGN